MRRLTWILTLPLFVAAIVFSLQNRMQVDISFWPFDARASLPLSVLSIGLLSFGFIGGILSVGLMNIGHFFEMRRLKKEIAALKNKIEKQSASPLVPPSGPTILSHGRYQPVPPPNPQKGKRFFCFKRKDP
jgi:uncharacterized membrane protein YciS (DUF1049 family)